MNQPIVSQLSGFGIRGGTHVLDGATLDFLKTPDRARAERVLHEARQALQESGEHFRELVDALPAAIYVTDAEGRLTHFNRAAVEFSGRTPELGTDHWCVTWKLYRPDGTYLPHDECPMAVALKEGRIVRGAEAIAERPDGKRLWFTPYPTPIFDAHGKVVGGINMLLDITERKLAEESLRQSEQFNRSLVESSGDCIKTLSLDGNLLWISEAGLRTLGVANIDDAIGKSYIDLWEGADRKAARNAVVAARRGGSGNFVGYFPVNDQPRWWNVLVSPILGADGTPERLLAVSRDVTQRTVALKALSQRARQQSALFQFSEKLQRAVALEEVYEATLDSLKEAVQSARSSILLFDDEGVMRFVASRGLSESYCQAVEGHSPWRLGELDPQPIAMADVETADIDESLRDVIRKEGISSLAFIPLVADDRLIGKFMVYYDQPHDFCEDELELDLTLGRQLALAIQRKRAAEELLSSESRLRDLSERLEDLVLERTSELMQINEQLQGFTYSVAHDLRQQVRGINCNAAMLKLDAVELLDECHMDTLTELIGSSKRLSTLTDDLLTYARLGKQDVKSQPLDFTALAKEVAAYVMERVSCTKGTGFRVAPNLTARGDLAMLRIVLENLIDNACKYSRESKAPLVEVGKEGDAFFVRDNGIGFDMDFAHKLFKPFERLHRETEYSGTGIGLANVKRIVEKHGGRVWAIGELGRGATFYFTLPRT